MIDAGARRRGRAGGRTGRLPVGAPLRGLGRRATSPGPPRDIIDRAAIKRLPEEDGMTTRDKIIDDFGAVLTEAEELLQRAGNETGERARDLRSQVESKLLSAKMRLQELEGQALDQARYAVRATDDYVHDNPWPAVGVAAAVGFVVGLLLNRR